MKIIETCPKCGHDIDDYVLAIGRVRHVKECPNCGLSWERILNNEEVKRVPFDPNGWIERA